MEILSRRRLLQWPNRGLRARMENKGGFQKENQWEVGAIKDDRKTPLATMVPGKLLEGAAAK